MALNIRKIELKDNPSIEDVVRTVMIEYGACGEGFSIHDEELMDMYHAYSALRHRYFVLEAEGEVIGGGGVAPLKGGDGETCELRKMFILQSGRGRGFGKKILNLCLEAAKEMGFKKCYLETTSKMIEANGLYKRAGFSPLSGPKGATGHFGCDVWYSMDL